MKYRRMNRVEKRDMPPTVDIRQIKNPEPNNSGFLLLWDGRHPIVL